MVFGATGFEHIEVFVFEIRITFFVDRVERVHEAIAEGIGIDVERRMDEVRDVGPECFIAFLEVKDRAEGFCLNGHPEGVNIIWCQFALCAGGVEFALEIVERDLTHDRVDHVFDFAREHHLAVFGRLCTVEHFAEGEHFAKDGGRFGQSQRR